jgi:hypothetical protein
MKFSGWDKGVPDKINSWGLPARIHKLLVSGLMPLVDGHPADMAQDDDGMSYAVRFSDPENSEHLYAFDLRLKRSDEAFWVWDINGYALNGDGDVCWESNPKLL